MTRILIVVVLAVLVLGALFIGLRPEGSGDGPRKLTVDVSIKGDTMTPSEIVANEGDDLVLRFTADQEMELHMHGYDKTEELEPGETKTIEFKADRTGSFDIENEAAHSELGKLVVQPR